MPWNNLFLKITISICFLWSRSRLHDWNVPFVNDAITLHPASGEGGLSTKATFMVCTRAEGWRSSQKACTSLGKPRRKAIVMSHSHTHTTSLPSSTRSPHRLVGDRGSTDTEGQRHPEGRHGPSHFYAQCQLKPRGWFYELTWLRQWTGNFITDAIRFLCGKGVVTFK